MEENSIEDKFEEKDTQTLEKIEEIKGKVSKIFRIDQTKINDEIVETISEMHRYITIIAEEKVHLTKLKRKKNELYGLLYEKYKFKGAQKLDNKHEIETWINRTPKFQLITTFIEHQTTLLTYMESIVQCLRDKKFALKDLVDMLKIENG